MHAPRLGGVSGPGQDARHDAEHDDRDRWPVRPGRRGELSFGRRDESGFDGAMRMAFCLDGGYAQPVGVVARQADERIELAVEGAGDRLTDDQLERVRHQVARVISLDHDGEAFDRLCRADPALDQVHQRSPGFRPALFYSPYEAAVWSVISARRARAQGIRLRARLAADHGTGFALAGEKVYAVPTPEALLVLEALPGLPADRIPRLHAIAEAAGGAISRPTGSSAATGGGNGRTPAIARHRAVLQCADRDPRLRPRRRSFDAGGPLARGGPGGVRARPRAE